jgi:hypothetical protein
MEYGMDWPSGCARCKEEVKSQACRDVPLPTKFKPWSKESEVHEKGDNQSKVA